MEAEQTQINQIDYNKLSQALLEKCEMMKNDAGEDIKYINVTDIPKQVFLTENDLNNKCFNLNDVKPLNEYIKQDFIPHVTSTPKTNISTLFEDITKLIKTHDITIADKFKNAVFSTFNTLLEHCPHEFIDNFSNGNLTESTKLKLTFGKVISNIAKKKFMTQSEIFKLHKIYENAKEKLEQQNLSQAQFQNNVDNIIKQIESLVLLIPTNIEKVKEMSVYNNQSGNGIDVHPHKDKFIVGTHEGGDVTVYGGPDKEIVNKIDMAEYESEDDCGICAWSPLGKNFIMITADLYDVDIYDEEKNIYKKIDVEKINNYSGDHTQPNEENELYTGDFIMANEQKNDAQYIPDHPVCVCVAWINDKNIIFSIKEFGLMLYKLEISVDKLMYLSNFETESNAQYQGSEINLIERINDSSFFISDNEGRIYRMEITQQNELYIKPSTNHSTLYQIYKCNTTINCIRMLFDESTLFAGGLDKFVRSISLKNSKKQWEVSMNSKMVGLEICRGEHALVAMSHKREVRVLNINSGVCLFGLSNFTNNLTTLRLNNRTNEIYITDEKRKVIVLKIDYQAN